MTTYTNTKVGQITEVRSGIFMASLDVDANGELPVITVAGEQVPVGQPGSYIAITSGDIRILAMISSMVESDKRNPTTVNNLTGQTNDKQVTIGLVPLGEVNSAGVFESGVRNFPVSGSAIHPVNEEDIKSIFVKFRAQGYSVGTAPFSASPVPASHGPSPT